MRRWGGGGSVGGGAVGGEGEDDNKGAIMFGFGGSRCRGDCGWMGRGWIVFGRQQRRGGAAHRRGGEGRRRRIRNGPSEGVLRCSVRGEDDDKTMEIDGEEMAEAEAAAIVEKEEYRLKELDFSSLNHAEKVREKDDRDRGGRWGGRGGEDIKRKKRAGRGERRGGKAYLGGVLLMSAML